MTNDVEAASNAVINVEGAAGGGETSLWTGQLDYKAFIRAALQSQTSIGMKIGDDHFVEQHVNHVGVIPHALRSECGTADHHSVDAVVEQNVVPYE